MDSQSAQNASSDLQGKITILQKTLEELEGARSRAETEAAKFRLLFENAIDGILVADCQTHRFILANQRICGMLGYTREELLERTIEEIHPPEVVPQALELFGSLMREELDQLTDYPLLRKDGGLFHADITAGMLILDSRPAAVGFFRDVEERSQAREQLWRREAELAGIFRIAPIGIGVLINRVFLKVNQQLCDLVGYTEKELLGQNARILYPTQEDYDFVGREKYNQIQAKGTGTVESRWLTKDGRILDVLLSSTPLDVQDWSKGVTFTALDISDRKRAQEALAERLKMEQFVSSISAGFVNLPADQVDEEINRVLGLLAERLDLDIVRVYETTEDMSRIFTGAHLYCREDLVALPYEDVDRQLPTAAGKIRSKEAVWYTNLPDDLPEKADSERTLLRDLGAQTLILIPMFVGKHVVGALSLFSRTRKVPFSQDLMNFLKLVGEILANALLRQKNERALEFTQFAVEHMADSAFWMTPDARFFYVNEAACRNLGRSREELLRMGVGDIDPDYPAQIWPEHWQRLKKQITRTFESRHQTRDGKIFPVEIIDNFVMFEGSEYNCAFARDITDRKLAQQAQEKLLRELRVKNEELESIVFIASHDLRSPLVNIEGFTGEVSKSCQELRKVIGQVPCSKEIRQQLDYLLEKDIPESIRFITAGTAKMDALLSGLLRLSRIGTATIHIDPVQMNLLIQTVLGSMRFEIQRLGAEIRTEDLPNCMGDAVLINQVFSNLIDNAIKYRHPDRPAYLRITGSVQGEQVHYAVADNGIGIDPQHHEKIFEIFHQLNPGGPQGGQGLGLTIVRRILDRLDGRVLIESSRNAGSTFTVVLPRVR